eukprot:3921206-Prorocentrum_lima.AAC.1
MTSSLVGSEMCIRDSHSCNEHWQFVCHDPRTLRDLATVLHRIAYGHLPHDALRAVLATSLAVKLKPS